MRAYLKKKKNHKERVSGVAQGVGPKFKPQYPKIKKKKNIYIYALKCMYVSSSSRV
jgi:hypothetical protein